MSVKKEGRNERTKETKIITCPSFCVMSPGQGTMATTTSTAVTTTTTTTTTTTAVTTSATTNGSSRFYHPVDKMDYSFAAPAPVNRTVYSTPSSSSSSKPQPPQHGTASFHPSSTSSSTSTTTFSSRNECLFPHRSNGRRKSLVPDNDTHDPDAIRLPSRKSVLQGLSEALMRRSLTKVRGCNAMRCDAMQCNVIQCNACSWYRRMLGTTFLVSYCTNC